MLLLRVLLSEAPSKSSLPRSVVKPQSLRVQEPMKDACSKFAKKARSQTKKPNESDLQRLGEPLQKQDHRPL